MRSRRTAEAPPLPAPVPVHDADRPLIAFFLLTFAVTWACWGAGALLPSTLAGPRLALLLLGSFAPSVVGTLVTARTGGRVAVRALLGRLLKWRVRPVWYVFALGFMVAVKLVVAVVLRLVTGSWPQFGHQHWYTVAVLIVVAGIVGGPLGEEVGWRGFALPRMAGRLGTAGASLLLGVVWACWHLPLFLLAGSGYDQYGQSFPLYLLQVMALSVAIAWLMKNTGGSLLLAVLMHSAINQTKDIVTSKVPVPGHAWALSSSLAGWVTVAVLWACAAYFLVRMSRAERRR